MTFALRREHSTPRGRTAREGEERREVFRFSEEEPSVTEREEGFDE